MPEYTIVKYKANWCGNCNMLSKVIDKVIPEFPQVHFETVDVDESKERANSEGVTTIPTLSFYRNGKKVDTFPGLMSPDSLRHRISDAFNISPLSIS